MKRVGKILVCLAGGVMLNAALRAADANPYTPIATRNVFDIKPPPPVDPSAPDPALLPKILPTGIVSTFGHWKVLFQVAPTGQPGQPSKDRYYILGEGERQEDIEVTKIDAGTGIVTFNNHGAIQQLPLANATPSGGPAPAQGGPGPGPNFPRPGFMPGGGGGGNPGGFVRFGQSRDFGGQNPNANNSGANSGSRLGVVLAGAGGNASPQPQNAMSADDQAALITANHAIAVANGDPTARIFPPTQFDAEAGVPSNLATPPPLPGGPASP